MSSGEGSRERYSLASAAAISSGCRSASNARERQVLLGRLIGEKRVLQHALLIELADFFRLRSRAPDGVDAGLGQHQFRAPAARRRHQDDAHAFAARTTGAAGAMLQHLRVIRQLRVNDKTDVRQVYAARRHVGGHANTRTSVAQGLQRVRPLVLRQLSRQRHHGKSALQERRLQMTDGISGVAKDDGARRFKIPQQVDDGVLDIVRDDADGAVLDVGVAAFAARDFDAECVFLILPGQRHDSARQRRRE
jgi:hypothetical protein